MDAAVPLVEELGDAEASVLTRGGQGGPPPLPGDERPPLWLFWGESGVPAELMGRAPSGVLKLYD